MLEKSIAIRSLQISLIHLRDEKKNSQKITRHCSYKKCPYIILCFIN